MTERIMTRQQAGQAPGVVKIRLSGAAGDVAMVAALLTGYDGCGIDVIEQSAPYPNRRDPGRAGIPDRPRQGGR